MNTSGALSKKCLKRPNTQSNFELSSSPAIKLIPTIREVPSLSTAVTRPTLALYLKYEVYIDKMNKFLRRDKKIIVIMMITNEYLFVPNVVS